MKLAICILSLVITSNVFASEGSSQATLMPTLITTASTAISSGAEVRKEAELVLRDAQEYNQAGTLTVYLEKKIIDTRAEDSSLSETEALDVLIENAEAILN